MGWIREGKDNATSVPLQIFHNGGILCGNNIREPVRSSTLYGEIASFVPLFYIFGPSVGVGAGRFGG